MHIYVFVRNVEMIQNKDILMPTNQIMYLRQYQFRMMVKFKHYHDSRETPHDSDGIMTVMKVG